MNAAARLFSQRAHSRSWVVSVLLSRTHFMTVVLVLSLLTTSLGIIYVTNASRSLNAIYQQTLADRGKLHVQWGQLLLEKSTWITQARVQRVAEHNIGMIAPDRKSVVLIQE